MQSNLNTLFIMKVQLKFQSVKHQSGVNYVVFKTDKEISHTDEKGKTTKDCYLTKSALTFLKEGGDVSLDAITTLGQQINSNIPQVSSLIAKAAILCSSAEVKETLVKKNQIIEGHSESFEWYYHEISSVTEGQMSRFAETAYFKAVEAFNSYMAENAI